MHIQGSEFFTFNRITLACFHTQGRAEGVRLFMRYFQDSELLRHCQLLGGDALRHSLRVPKDQLWAAHNRRVAKGQAFFTDLQLKQICSRARTPNEHFWGKTQFRGGAERIEELAEGVRDRRIKAGFTGCWRKGRKEQPPRQYTVSGALRRVLLSTSRGRKNRKTLDQLLEALFEFALRHPENCSKFPKTLAKLRKRAEHALTYFRGAPKAKFKRGDRVYHLRWAEESNGGKRGRGPSSYWLKPA